MIHSLVTTGKATHLHGGEMKPSSGELVRLMERMAHLRPPKRRRGSVPEQFTPQTTNKGTTDGATDSPHP
jgi:hypothetical protein